MRAEIVKINDVKVNPNNPRLIKDDKFAKLVQSIKDLPQMLAIRPIVVNTDMVVLGGNMRLKACKEAGLKEVPIIIADNLTEEQQREFLIKDNVSGGEWDWALLQEWDTQELQEWGLDVPVFETKDYSDKNEEIDIDSMDSDMIIKLKYTEDEYNLVREQLSKIASTPEQAVWKLLGNE
jgi:ParB-like chromosome segregation protein Spo0J